jgi:hypothetical protein
VVEKKALSMSTCRDGEVVLPYLSDSDAIYAVFLFSVLVYPLDIHSIRMNYCSQSTTEFGLYVTLGRTTCTPTPALRLEASES